MAKQHYIGGLPAERWIGRRLLGGTEKKRKNTHSCVLKGIRGDKALIKPMGHKRVEEVPIDNLGPWWSKNKDLEQERNNMDADKGYVIWYKSRTKSGWWCGKPLRWTDKFDLETIKRFDTSGNAAKAKGKIASSLHPTEKDNLLVVNMHEAKEIAAREEAEAVEEPKPEEPKPAELPQKPEPSEVPTIEQALEQAGDRASGLVSTNGSITLSQEALLDPDMITKLQDLAKATKDLRDAQAMVAEAKKAYDRAIESLSEIKNVKS